MSYRDDWVKLIRRLAPRYGIDPRAALAVASTEGLSGGVGDGGHAFGPFQLNDAGGVITGRPGDHRAFAESPEGIDWALRQISGVAKGLRGRSAIEQIVRRFERPADPQGEIQRALVNYPDFGGAGAGPALSLAVGGGQPAAPQPAPSSLAAAAAPDRQTLARQLLSTSPRKQPDLLQMLVERQLQTRAQQPTQTSAPVRPDRSLPARGTEPPTGSSEFAMVDAEGAPDARGVKHHGGYDWMLGANNTVPALEPGVVVEAKPSRGTSGQIYGGVVKVRTPDGRVVVYRHVDPRVRPGQRVKAGAPVAAVTRWSDNPASSHAHTELWKSLAGGYRFENMVDPLTLIRRRNP